jgi:hypothetical protein
MPQRGRIHDALHVFLGDWHAEGVSYGGTDQSGPDPKANGESWVSTHVGRWHAGEFFLIQDEMAVLGGKKAFNTLSIMGIDAQTGRCFARCFENHGFSRDYDVSWDGDIWTFDGETERASIAFIDNGRRQKITWEWKPGDRWLPLCDRTAVRKD